VPAVPAFFVRSSMNRMFRIVLVVPALALASIAPSHAEEWFVISSKFKECVTGAEIAKDSVENGFPPISSPYELAQELENRHLQYTVEPIRLDNGQLYEVRIHISDTTQFWFLSREYCNLLLAKARANGLSAPSEMSEAKPNQSHASTQGSFHRCPAL
jgi:hypothetical protein